MRQMSESRFQESVVALPQSSVGQMRNLFRENRDGRCKGIYSVCSANRFVLEAAFAQAQEDGSLLLIEATCNQVNHEGGYTGQTPEQFRKYVHGIATQKGFAAERIILGGDHLGPHPWRSLPAEAAMEKACRMVAAFVKAGFRKIHLDASMSCASDPAVLDPEVIAERAARLCEAAETSLPISEDQPVYVIGTEVPTPGGTQGEMELEVTTIPSLQQTLNAHRLAFVQRNLHSAWDRIIAVVVQPGVEFSDNAVADYVPERAQALSRAVLEQENIVFEAHSTDYQTSDHLRQLVRDHFAILKVGPELTFMMREAIFGLGRIEEEWIPDSLSSRIRSVVERVMVEHPEHWNSYYRGNEASKRIARAFSLSDRIRYYWPNGEIFRATEHLIRNLRSSPAPLPLIRQYLPRQAEAIRVCALRNDPAEIIQHKIRESLSRYAAAC
jgi:D-tagatose-1,6-bisphosphate aldolase subunit GatZ/KbaZ